MKAQKNVVSLMTVLFALIIGTLLIPSQDSSPVPLSFLVRTSAGEEEIFCWEKEEGRCYVFLPGYAELDELVLQAQQPICLDGMTLDAGGSCGDIKLGWEYDLSGVPGMSTLVFLRSSVLPTMYIDTASGNMDYIHQKKGNEEGGTVRLYRSDGTMDYNGNFVSVKMRGNNTKYSDKKPYSLKLTAEGDLLDMGAAQKWILLSNSFDATHLRNKTCFDFAREFGLPYTPDNRWVDLYLNGEYAGLYLLSERNEIHPQRTDIGPEDSFLVSMEMEYRLKEADLPHVLTQLGVALYIRDSDIPANGLLEKFQSLEDAIRYPDHLDPKTGKHWSELMDLDSWARKYLLEEVFGNMDGGQVSQYFFLDGRDPQGRIYAGPAWDYDMTLANPVIYGYTTPNMMYLDTLSSFFGSAWYSMLWEDPQFASYTTELYEKECLPLINQFIQERMEEYSQEIRESAKMDQIRWNTLSASEETEKVIGFLKSRTEFLADFWQNKDGYIRVYAATPNRNVTFALKPGDRIPEIEPFEGYSWYEMDRETPFDITQPVYETVKIELRPDPGTQVVD